MAAYLRPYASVWQWEDGQTATMALLPNPAAPTKQGYCLRLVEADKSDSRSLVAHVQISFHSLISVSLPSLPGLHGA